MIYHNDFAVEQLGQKFINVTKNPLFFATAVIENPEPAALNWNLTDDQRNALLNHFKKYPNGPAAQEIERIKNNWW